MFWFGGSKAPPAVDEIYKIKMAKHQDICFGQESDVEVMDSLSNQLEEEVEGLSRTVHLQESDGKNDNCLATVCEYSDSLTFSFDDSWSAQVDDRNCILDDHRRLSEQDSDSSRSPSQPESAGPKHQHLRLVSGRLQVVGFNEDCRDHTTNRSKYLRSRKRKTHKPFWSELIYFLTK